MKTATIHIYQPFGINTLFADVMYRGRVLKTLDKGDVLDWSGLRRGLIDAAKAYAEGRGFTHFVVTQ